MSLKTYFSQVFKLLFCVKVFNYALFCGVNVIRDKQCAKRQFMFRATKSVKFFNNKNEEQKQTPKLKLKQKSMFWTSK